mmetsp:Transcript_44553/g.69668  ORF Transcript_44553/g.69668 Transcript_44553/m.69668 type:complete len:438 (-) Transcript_44553:530-1843(-)|eukprot:CAMPEP_0194724864 /NCGR_PEP_ID=MMETSP0296-20130528/23623_1 /TAXON_ID=39354 /ORGANISM="Heterosigma akashiwo, Strain CCMP2393" /LENGTH=437 /DNA_ID=CAMNT_0039629057 /DNA_START=156 /DNA_END=1469 /DNA_ORIENTATION=+
MMGALGIIVAILVVGCAVLAAMGFKGRISVVGVDLGTTYSVIGINNGGTVEIVPDKEGHVLVPSTVAFLPEGRVAVGRAARRYLEHDPTHTIYNAKRFIGRAAADPSLVKELAEHDFELVERPGNASEGWFRLDEARGHGAAVAPEGVGARVLLHLKAMVADHLGYDQVDKAVIAVPAKFDARQRQMTAEAYRQAGLRVMRVLEEPTAAALAYGLHRKPDVHHILVYDFGGGTLDVSVLFVNEGSVEVEASEGDDHLGGSDFDQCLAHHLTARLGPDLVDAGTFRRVEACRGAMAEAHLCTQHLLYPLSEELKRRLSDQLYSDVRCMVQRPGASSMRGGEADVCAPANWVETQLTVTRDEFEHACSDLFERAMIPVDLVLEEVGLTARGVDEVVMVGGTTRIPRVRARLKEHLGVESLNTHIDPDITVAYGAATVID